MVCVQVLVLGISCVFTHWNGTELCRLSTLVQLASGLSGVVMPLSSVYMYAGDASLPGATSG